MTERSFFERIYDWATTPYTDLTQEQQTITGAIEAAAANTAFDVNDNTLGQSEYNFTFTTFPDDISNDYIGHYMVININVPVLLTDSRKARTAYGPSTNRTVNIATQTLTDQASKVDALRFGNAENIGGVTNFGSEPLVVPRFTRRIKESIALYMPTPLVFNTINDYQDISLSSFGSGLLSQVGGLVGGRIGGEAGATAGAGIGDTIARGASQAAGLARFPINPRVEVIFSKTALRQFVFEFLFAPRNEKESLNMERIIRTLRYHSVPEIDPATLGWTFIPPAELDITFFHQGRENRKIPRINTCVVDRIEVDYAPQGEYATFSNGHPVAARLSLGLREVELLHKRRILQGF